MYYWDGRKFQGNYENGKLNGKGIEYRPNGLKWEGLWLDGYKDQLSGKFINQEVKEPCSPDKKITRVNRGDTLIISASTAASNYF